TKWFGDVVICTRGQSGNFVILVVSGSEHENIAIREFPDSPADLHSIQLRQAQIQYHHIWRPRPCLFTRPRPSMRLRALKASPHQITLDHLSQGLLIVDDQHPTDRVLGCSSVLTHSSQYLPNTCPEETRKP